MKVGLFAPLRSPVASPELIADLGAKAEAIGVYSLWLGEHVVLFPEYESSYPGRADGKFVFPAQSGLLDMTATLGFLAARTSTLRLGTGIRILPQANPVYTAKEYATLDFLSKGRIDFGIGVGWSWEEFEACGVPFERRGARCDEYIEILRTLWCDERSSFSGEFYTLPECLMYPKPIQSPMIPITVGGHSAGALRRTARIATGWYGINLRPEELAPLLDRLNGYLVEEGRKPGDVRIIVGTTGLEIPVEDVAAYAEAGADELLLPYLRQSERWLDAFIEGLKPYLDAAAALPRA
ncbi:MAG: LLM class F420-dependent oxidoreductase [Chromatiales bacterium]|jgi:probable F420-dependent oxidoreductase|nr:LLM class F420-dependent oxidoreductase [Chromatiales bacterium]